MATGTAPTPYSRLRGSETLPGRRGVPATIAVRATALADLQDEIAALTQERAGLGRELAGLSVISYRGSLVDDPGLARHVAGRLRAIAESLARRGGG